MPQADTSDVLSSSVWFCHMYRTYYVKPLCHCTQRFMLYNSFELQDCIGMAICKDQHEDIVHLPENNSATQGVYACLELAAITF